MVVIDFLGIHAEEFGPEVNKTVLESRIKSACSKTTVLPSDEDIKILREYLDEKRIEAFNSLQKKVFINCLAATVRDNFTVNPII